MLQKFEDFVKESRFVDLINKKFTGEKRKEDIKHTYYQPVVYKDDGINIDYSVPKELHSTDVFQSMEDCEEWLNDHDYDIEDCNIEEYDVYDTDPEEITILDSDGNPIE